MAGAERGDEQHPVNLWLIDPAAGREIGDVDHRMAGADDVERRIEDVLGHRHGMFPNGIRNETRLFAPLP